MYNVWYVYCILTNSFILVKFAREQSWKYFTQQNFMLSVCASWNILRSNSHNPTVYYCETANKWPCIQISIAKKTVAERPQSVRGSSWGLPYGNAIKGNRKISAGWVIITIKIRTWPIIYLRVMVMMAAMTVFDDDDVDADD